MTQKVTNSAEQAKPAKAAEAAKPARAPETQEAAAHAPKAAAVAHEAAAQVAAAEVVHAAPVAEAPVQVAMAEAPVAPKAVKVAKVDADKDAKDEDKQADDQPVDLAMFQEVEFIEHAGGALPATAEEISFEGLAFQDDAADDGSSGGGIILPILAVAAAGAGIAILASGGDDDNVPPAPPPPPPPPPNVAPVVTSATTATIAENSPTTTQVYKVTATDANAGDTITYSIEGADAAAFNIDGATGVVTFKASPDFETKSSYAITVKATDKAGLSDTENVTITVTDVNETTTTNLDTDNDANPNTAQTFDAAGGNIAYTDSDTVASKTIINNFANGDTISISGTANVSFGTADGGKDLRIIVNKNGVVSEIVLNDVVPANAGFITNEQTAETALGFNFYSDGDAAAAANSSSFG